MKLRLPRRGSRRAEPVRVELAGLPRQLVPAQLTVNHVIKREPPAPPLQMWAVIASREGYHYRGQVTRLSGYPQRVYLPLPTSAQIAIKSRETGEYVPLDHIQVELAYHT